MTDRELSVLRETLRKLRYQGTTLTAFSKEIGIPISSLYNYVCGQRPSSRTYRYLQYQLKEKYPAAVSIGEALAE